MKRTLIIILLLFFLPVCLFQSQTIEKITDPVDYVNPLMGTMSDFELSTGNTYPAIGMPWGMNLWTPQTGKNGDGWQYKYTDRKIRGFKQTHQPSPWMNDYGEFSIMPITGKSGFNEDDRASWFSHKTEIVHPYYYQVYLADQNVWADMTTSTRAAQLRFKFPKEDNAAVVIDAYDRGSYVKVIPAERKVVGYTTRNSGGVPNNFKNFFVITFDQPFTASDTWQDNNLSENVLEQQGNHVGALVHFKPGQTVIAKVASSFISPEQAELNLKQEIGNESFEQTEAKSKSEWNKELGKVEVSGGTIDQIRTFYSALYRMLFFPLRLYEKDKTGHIVHYSPYNGNVEQGYMFGGTGFWDTFRAEYPFLTLMYPEINVEMQKGLINDYKEGGWLPEWSSPGYRNIMIGNNSASVVAGAYIKGLRGYDIGTLYQALIKDANNEGPIDAVGRKGVKYYNKLGFVPYDVGIGQNAARTLEYAYDDFAIYSLGKALGKPESETNTYAQRSQNYRNLFDATHNLMRPKNQDGTFHTPFDPFKWGDAFTEGNSWHYTWAVFHDPQGLINLMKGKKVFTQMLDSVFVMPPTMSGYDGHVIHEMREMQIAGMGQYAHGNQPIQHMIYLYDWANEPWKTQYWARETMNRLYSATPDGYIGDEDNGQTSAWYVFSAIGFYPVNPASTQYALGAPLFRKITLHLSNGKAFVINAPKNSETNKYIGTAKLNGKIYNKNWIDHFDIIKGGTFDLNMQNQPNKRRGISRASVPYSFSKSE